MKTAYAIQAERLVAVEDDRTSPILVYTQPNDQERAELQERFALELADLESIYDPDEVPRLEYSPEGTLIIWKNPENITHDQTIQFEVSSIGVIIKDGQIVMIFPRSGFDFAGREFKRVTSPMDFLLRALLQSIHHYQGHLKAIKAISNEMESKIAASMENKYLLLMFTLGESLVYYHNALEANTAILTKLKMLADRLKFSADEMELLDDVMIENQQAAKQAGIYTRVLSGLMDARASVINNNMNVLLKNLTIINVVFLPLNLIASIGGMSEYTMMTEGLDWRVSYGLFLLLMVIVGFATWWLLIYVYEKRRNPFGTIKLFKKR